MAEETDPCGHKDVKILHLLPPQIYFLLLPYKSNSPYISVKFQRFFFCRFGV